jgi:mitosis inhibitor protein kinase SWE1
MFALDSPESSTPAHLRPRPAFGHLASASRHSFACTDASFFGRAGENRGFAQSTAPSSPVSELREAEMGEISDEDGSDFAPVEVDLRALDGEGMEDLFFSNSSFVPSRDVGPDTSFGWDSTPIAISSSLTVNVTESTPSPRSKLAPAACKLEKKYRPRDSGVVLSEDEGNNPASHPVHDFVPPAPRHRYTLGRSESVNLTLPRASTSVSTLGSGSSDQELITPIFGPSTSACWPVLTSSSSAASSLGTPDVASVDAFITRTLMQAARRDEHAPLGGSDVGGSIRPPGTPQKRVKTAMAFSGARPWQSAVASKIGFDFEDEEDEARGPQAGSGAKPVKRSKKAPRKSLPAAFPLLSKASRNRGGRATGGEDSEDERDGSPIERRSAYDGLGLGRPSVAKAAGASWLLRRSSSGAISNATSGSGSMSGDGSPTGTVGAIHSASSLFRDPCIGVDVDGPHRLAASPTANPPTDVPAQVEHSEPPRLERLEPDRLELVRGVLYCHDHDARLTDNATAAVTSSKRTTTPAWEQRTRDAGIARQQQRAGDVRAARKVRTRVCRDWGSG